MSKGEYVAAARVALQLVRIPLLLIVLWATARPARSRALAMSRLEPADMWTPWVLMCLLSMAFVVLVLVGRRRRHPWLVLALEAGVAAALALVPPTYWLLWRGVDSWFAVMAGGHVQPLAMAWLGVVGLRAFHQLRGAGGGFGPKEKGPARELIDYSRDG
jgi:hypothetical protein